MFGAWSIQQHYTVAQSKQFVDLTLFAFSYLRSIKALRQEHSGRKDGFSMISFKVVEGDEQ
jgi:hypothetical protein